MNIIEVLIKAAVSPEFRGALSSATSQIQATEKTVEGMGSRTKSSFGAMASSITGSFGAIGLAIQGVKQSMDLIWNAGLKQTDEYQRLENRIRSTGLAGEDLARVQKSLMEAANSTRSSYAGTVELYSRLAISSKDLGTNEKELLSFTKSLNQAIQLSGASSQEAENGLIQLSQGMASGTLRGDELRSVLEQLPAVADVISEHLGVSRGQLRKMGEDGKITAKVIMESFAGARQELSDRFAAQIPTAGQAAMVFKNQILELAGEKGKGALGQLSAGIMDAGGALEELKPLLSAVGFVAQSTFQILRVAFLGLRAFFQGLIPLIVSELGRLLSWSLSTMIGWAEKINGIVGKLLPKTWQDGFAANLASAKAWTEDMGSYFKDVADDSVGFLDQVSGKMADVYRPRDEIAVPGKKKGAGGVGGGAGDGKLSAEERNQAQIDAFLNKQAAERSKHEDELAAKLFQTKVNNEKRLEAKQLETQKTLAQEEKKRAEVLVSRIASFGAPLVNGLSQGIQNVLTKGHIGVASIAKSMRDGLVQAAADFIAKMAVAGIFKLIGGAVGGGIGAGMTGYGKSLLGFAVGTPRVPRDMAAMIHSGEGIIPKDFMDGIRSGELTLGGPGAGGGHSASLVLGSDIIAAIKDQGHALVKIVSNQGRVSFA